MKELGAEVGGGLIIHHGLIIHTLRYVRMSLPVTTMLDEHPYMATHTARCKLVWVRQLN